MGRKARRRAEIKAARKPQIGGGPPPAAIGQLSEEECFTRLREAFLAEFPMCPDCGAPWDLDTAGEEYGPVEDAFVYSIAAPCSAYQDDEDAGRPPARHSHTDGLGTYAIAVREDQVSVYEDPH